MSQMAAVNLIGSHDYALVALSVLIAMFASYAALDLAGRVSAAGGWTRAAWLLGGAGAMGTGIWSMHYIGMLAFILPIPVAYHWPTVLLSLIAAIVASVIALYVVSRQKMGTSRAVAASLLMGAGIASMHYIGMDAMRLPAICRSNSSLVVLSVVFAVLISFAALWITFHFRGEKTGSREKLAGAVVMGAAIPVMHYTGMAAASFTSSGMPADLSHAVSVSTLGTAGIAAVAFIVLGLALLTSWVDRRFAAQTLELQEEKLQRSEAYLAEAQRLTHTGSWAWRVAGGVALHLSEEWYRIYGFDPEKGPPAFEERRQRTHPEDRAKWQGAIDRAIAEKSGYEVEFRLLLPDGSVKHLHTVGHPVLNASGDLVQFVGSSTDITERKQAEEKIRQSEMELRQILDFAPQCVAVLGPDRDRTRLYTNQTMLDYFGFTLEEWRSSDRRKYYHPDDWERLTSETQSKFLSGLPHEYEARFLRKDGKYRWFLFRWNPLRDEQGRVTRWYAAATDIEERKQAEQRLQNENVALREEIDRASMFEEIVGTSPPLQTVLSRISKVAPTDSSVLITGETGTGKELVARGIHKRSRRSLRPFVSVNCAAIPRDLIASELFGHEKGAFTGATQRRLGRFELAEGGTIFLDEVGELPAETQIALLRVLQEHEFERVGGTRSIRTDVRVIAATNRDLQAAIAAGAFRSDLFYRLNVFPIETPPLRERKEDIPLLVEYFIDRYARKAGKSIRGINKKSLDLLRSYPWPGNIRELQNVIERSVIVCETENFSVDESWLLRQPLASGPKSQPELSRKLAAQEKEMIEAALRESGGQVSGPSGAAAKLGLPGSTLESKIRSLKINKRRFKTTNPPADRI